MLRFDFHTKTLNIKGTSMKDLNEVTQNLCKLRGEFIGVRAMINAILSAMPQPQLAATLQEFDRLSETEQVMMLNDGQTGEHVLRGLDAYVLGVSTMRRR